MEVESEFIFRPEKKAHLNDILQRILVDLNEHKECLLALDEANLLSLKLTRVVQVGSEGGRQGGREEGKKGILRNFS